MIKAWDKDGNEVQGIEEKIPDTETRQQLKALGFYLAILSQQAQVIIKRIRIESDQYIMDLEQK